MNTSKRQNFGNMLDSKVSCNGKLAKFTEYSTKITFGFVVYFVRTAAQESPFYVI